MGKSGDACPKSVYKGMVAEVEGRMDLYRRISVAEKGIWATHTYRIGSRAYYVLIIASTWPLTKAQEEDIRDCVKLRVGKYSYSVHVEFVEDEDPEKHFVSDMENFLKKQDETRWNRRDRWF